MMVSKINVLFVDDEQGILEGIEEALNEKGVNNYCVSTANSSSEAVAKLSNSKFDILLTDIKMPGDDGFVLMKKAIEINPDIQCIVMTAFGNVKNAVKAMQLGAINFLIKAECGTDEIDIAIIKAIEKIRLIQENKQQQIDLEEANSRLNRVYHIFKSGHAKRKYFEMLVDVTSSSLRYWKSLTKREKIDFAEESDIWTVTPTDDGAVCKTLDKYLSIKKLPKKKPKYDLVKNSADFALYYDYDISPKKEMTAELLNKISKLDVAYRKCERSKLQKNEVFAELEKKSM